MGNNYRFLTLEQKTQLFWATSRAYNHQDGPHKGITCEQAIASLSNLEEEIGPQKKLKSHVTRLLDNIIGVPSNNIVEDTGTDGPKAA